MIPRTITYKDLDGNDVTEEFHFHFNNVEALEFAAQYKGSPGAVIQKAFENIKSGNDADENEMIILKFFRELVAGSIGRRSESGKSFIKNHEYCSEFMNSDAYSTLFFDLVSDEKFAAEFVNGVFPKDMADIMAPKKPAYTEQQLLDMSDEEFDRVVGKDPMKLSKEQLMIAMKRRNRQAA